MKVGVWLIEMAQAWIAPTQLRNIDAITASWMPSLRSFALVLRIITNRFTNFLLNLFLWFDAVSLITCSAFLSGRS